MTPPLKPCPFCGSAPDIDTKRTLRFRVCCTDEDCPAWPDVYGKSEAEAIARWNRRAPSLEEGAARRHQEGRTT